ncbi:MAG: D-alanine--D-alanine ligase [Thermomicrobiales bacterium]|nr:MAG: D-alanine--D-alanine ligase [Thermomicrobiales bacterium]
MTSSMRRPRVVVLLGGPSAEHDVSVVSGTAIAEALADEGHQVDQVLIDLDGGWWWLADGHVREGRPAALYDDPAALGSDGPHRVGAAIDRMAAMEPAPVVFIALHGPFGEDGTVQALIEAAGLAYTGSGVAASAVGMDKTLFKRMCRGIGLPVVDWREVHASRWATEPDDVRAELDAFAAGADEPRLMVKPARLGSSVGMTLVHDSSELGAALETAFHHDAVALVETYLAGARDLEVALIGDETTGLELFGPGEIVSGHEFYDYEAKYTEGLSETSTRAEVSDRERATMRKIARDAYRAIGATGFARVDFLLVGERIVLSEINTIPGFTPISLFPTMPAMAGYTFGSICSKIVELGEARHTMRVRRHLGPEDLPR